MIVTKFAVLVAVAVYQVQSAPADRRKESDGSYKRLYLPYIQSVTKDGTTTILTSEDLLTLNKKLEGDILKTTEFQLIGINNFSHILSEHQLKLMARHEVAAIVNTQNLTKPGFGHLFLTIDDDGVVQTFVYNLSLEEAMEKVKEEGYPNSSSFDSFHKS